MQYIRKQIQSPSTEPPQIVDRPTKLSTGPDSGLWIAIYRESAFQAVEVSSAVDSVWVLGVSEYGFEFISDLKFRVFDFLFFVDSVAR